MITMALINTTCDIYRTLLVNMYDRAVTSAVLVLIDGNYLQSYCNPKRFLPGFEN